jgi:hypothetical protein
MGNAPSSGSSLLRVLLGRLPTVCTGGELAALDKPRLLLTSGRTYRRAIVKWFDRGYPRGFVGPTEPLFTSVEEYGWTRDGVRELCLAADSYSSMLHEFFRRTLQMSGKTRWLEKTPGNVFAFSPIREIFPTARFVHIVRDGRDAVASLARRGFSPLLAVSRWYYATLTGIQYREWPNYYELRYEDLVRSPREELTKLCAFLGEPFRESMLQGEGEKSSIVPSWRNNQHGQISAASVGRHEQELSSEQRAFFRSVRLSKAGRAALPDRQSPTASLSAFELQDYLGYGCDGLGGAPRLKITSRIDAAKQLARSQVRAIVKFHRAAPCAIALRASA